MTRNSPQKQKCQLLEHMSNPSFCITVKSTCSRAENIFNAFQRMLLRACVLNVKWPNTVRNEEVYKGARAALE